MEAKKDVWDKLEVIGGIVAGILIPIAIYFAGHAVSEADKQHARMALQAQQLTDMIEHLSSTNEKQQKIATEVANHLAKTNHLPEELITTLTRIGTESEKSDIAQSATQAVLIAANNDAEVQEAVKSAFENSPARLYFHIPRENLRTEARGIAANLLSNLGDDAENVIVPGIELRAGPQKNELRYFKSNERKEAEVLKYRLKEAGLDAVLVDLSGRYEASQNIRARHFELWIGNQYKNDGVEK